MIEHSPDEIIVVDYGYHENVGEWVSDNYPDVKVVHVDDDSGFCAS